MLYPDELRNSIISHLFCGANILMYCLV
jgi:hypothetical protein